LLRATGAELKVMQELMRHSTIRVTLDTYTQAVTTEKRAAQTAVVSLLRGKKPYWGQQLLRHHIRPVAKKLGITKRIGWHTFRRTYSDSGDWRTPNSPVFDRAFCDSSCAGT